MSTTSPTCRGLVLTCIDFRFVEPLRRLLAEQGLEGTTDVVAWPGGGLRVGDDPDAGVLDTLGLAHRLHSPEEVVLVAHHDCGWLGGSSRFADAAEEAEFLDRALATAAANVGRRFPGVTVRRVRLEAGRAHQA